MSTHLNRPTSASLKPLAGRRCRADKARYRLPCHASPAPGTGSAPSFRSSERGPSCHRWEVSSHHGWKVPERCHRCYGLQVPRLRGYSIDSNSQMVVEKVWKPGKWGLNIIIFTSCLRFPIFFWEGLKKIMAWYPMHQLLILQVDSSPESPFFWYFLLGITTWLLSLYICVCVSPDIPLRGTKSCKPNSYPRTLKFTQLNHHNQVSQL